MPKQKTSTDILIKTIKDMHPIYQSYLIDRIKKDIEVIKEELPALWEKDKIDSANGKISLFHPNFYVTYVNSIIEMSNSIDRLWHDNYANKDAKPFTPKPNVPYFEDETTQDK